MTALETYAPAIVATQQWYVGPGQQGDSLHAGYDQDAEDRLVLADRLADRRIPAVRDRALHRRPRLVRRHRREQLPVRRPASCSSSSVASTTASRWPAAATPTWICTSARCVAPGVNVASILGEGSFHQVHGGTTTNIAERGQPARSRLVVRRALPRAARPRAARYHQARALRRRDGDEGGAADAFATARSASASIRCATRSTTSTPQPAAGRRRAQARGDRGGLGEPDAGGRRPGSAIRVAPLPDRSAQLSGARRGACGRSSSWSPATTPASAAARSSSRPCCDELDRLGRRRSSRSDAAAVGPTPVEDRPAHDGSSTSSGPPDRRRPSPRCARLAGPEPAARVFLGLGAVAACGRCVRALRAPRPGRARTSSSRTPSSTGARLHSGFGPGPHEAVRRHPQPPPRVLRRPDVRALHAHVQPQRLS